jgi:hypothetical protein
VIITLHHARFRRRAHPHEKRDEHEKRIAEEPDEAEEQRHPLPDPGRDVRGPHVVHAHREHRAQHAAAVHGEGRDEVERGEAHVDPQQLHQEVAADPPHLGPGRERRGRRQDRVERCSQHDVDRGTGERDEQFLPRILGHPLEPRHAADGEQRDVARANAVVPRRERVAELVEHDDREQREDEDDARRGVGKAPPLEKVSHADPREQDEKGGVHVDVDARDPPQLPRPPGHGEL